MYYTYMSAWKYRFIAHYVANSCKYMYMYMYTHAHVYTCIYRYTVHTVYGIYMYIALACTYYRNKNVHNDVHVYTGLVPGPLPRKGRAWCMLFAHVWDYSWVLGGYLYLHILTLPVDEVIYIYLSYTQIGSMLCKIGCVSWCFSRETL